MIHYIEYRRYPISIDYNYIETKQIDIVLCYIKCDTLSPSQVALMGKNSTFSTLKRVNIGHGEASTAA